MNDKAASLPSAQPSDVVDWKTRCETTELLLMEALRFYATKVHWMADSEGALRTHLVAMKGDGEQHGWRVAEDAICSLSHTLDRDKVKDNAHSTSKAALTTQQHTTFIPEPSEFEIAKCAKEMETHYIEAFGKDALMPDFIESAKSHLSPARCHSLTGLTRKQLDIAIEAIHSTTQQAQNTAPLNGGTMQHSEPLGLECLDRTPRDGLQGSCGSGVQAQIGDVEIPPDYAAIPCIKRFMLNHLNGHQDLENAATGCYNSLRTMAAPFTQNKGD